MSTDTQNSAPVSVEPIVTLNGAQLLQALDFIAPDRDTDPTQLEGDVSILYGAGHAGSGYYCYLTDYPDEGAIMLDAETVDDLISSDSDPALTQQTLDDVKAGIPARDAEIAALRNEIEALQVAQAQQPVSGADGAGLKAVAHELKIHPEPFKDLSSGAKTSEVRNCADRQFNVGDVVQLREYEDGFYTGTELYRTITHIQRGYGLPEGICVLSYGHSHLPDATETIDSERGAIESALAELVDKIDHGLDTGDLLADAATASKALDSAQQDADNNYDLFFKLGCFIDYATGGRLSKLNWSLSTLKQSHDENLEALIEERIQEAKEDEKDADKVDAALAEMVHAMFRSGNSVPVTRITIDRKQYDAAIDAARKEQA